MSLSVKYQYWQALVLLLILACATTVILRIYYFGTESSQSEDTAWKIILQSHVATLRDKTVIRSTAPLPGQYYKLISQQYYHPGFRLLPSSKSRYLRARANETGTTKFNVEYYLQLSQEPLLKVKEKTELTTAQREKYLQSGKHYNLALPQLAIASEALNSKAANKEELVHAIFHDAHNLLKITKPRYDDLNNVLKSRTGTTLGQARYMVALCRLNGIPARVVTGFILDAQYANHREYWVEVYSEKENWQPYDSERGYEKTLPNNYVAFDYDNSELVSVKDGQLVSVDFVVQQAPEKLAELKLEKKNIFSVLNFYRLNMETKQALMSLFVLPFCVLLVVFIRQILGIQPYGVFAAPILALAMVHADLVFALLMTAVVIFMAVMGRMFLPRKMSRVPRVSIILIFVIMSMALSVSVVSYYSLEIAGNLIILPTIILAFVVDHFYSYMEKTGKKAALVRLGVTVATALLCMPVLEFEGLREFIFAFPEVHLLSVALVILFSVYKGKKLTDYEPLKIFKTDYERNKNRKNSGKV